MASNTVPFRLKSYQTALAIVAPSQFHADINSLRKLHDKAYERWEPHINVLYPFVDPEQLGEAIVSLRRRVEENGLRSFEVTLAGPDKFVQKRGATVHLKPDLDTEERIRQTRANLVTALGRNPEEGTHDGIFRAHMTIGQAGLLGPTLGMLVEKVTKLAPLHWQCRSLVVLKRQPSGKMVPVDEILLGGETKEEPSQRATDQPPSQHWKLCNNWSVVDGWRRLPEYSMLDEVQTSAHTKITISTYNLMADSLAPAFASRLEMIVDAIGSIEQCSDTRVLCLQEVSDEVLPLLLAHPKICKLYPYSTHLPSSLLPSDRNLATMASVPFSHTTIPFTERHKSVLMIDLHSMPIKIANIHLTAGLTDAAVATKKRQMELLTDFCLNQNISENIIIAGDFNLTTSTQTVETALARDMISGQTAQLVDTVVNPDIWEDAFLSSEALTTDDNIESKLGTTFDRIGNPLAALSISPIDDRPQRYDRVLYRKDGSLKVEHVQLFGLPDEKGHCGSDHYGFSAVLQASQNRETLDQQPLVTRNPSDEVIVVKQDSTNLQLILQSRLPTQEDRERRKEAIQYVQDVLSSGNDQSEVILAPLGSYLLETYFPDSDVDLLAIGSSSPQNFFQSVTSKFRDLDTGNGNETGVKGVHLVNSLVSIAEMCVIGIKFDLQYCQAPMLIERYHSVGASLPLHELAFDEVLVSSLPPSALRPFNTYRDTAYILKTVPDIESYRVAHRFLSSFLRNYGLYSAKFGYLGGIHLSLMLNRVVKLIDLQNSRPKSSDTVRPSPATIVSTFFSHYAAFNWSVETVSDPGLTEKHQPTRSSRDAIFIPAIHVPTARPNVASSCTPLSGRTLTEEFKAASDKLLSEGWHWCLNLNTGVQDFLGSFSAFISISLDVWSVDEVGGAKVREIIGALESKFPRLMLALGRLGGIYARVWPARFRSHHDNTQASDSTQFKGYYLVGIRIVNDNADIDAKRILRSKVTNAVRDFESTVKTSREFESGNCWLGTEFLAGKKIKALNLVIDHRSWDIEDVRDEVSHDPNDQKQKLVGVPELNFRPKAEDPRRPNTTPLRMPLDIINRIKHDAEHFSADQFLIGYEDRFEEGPKEVELLKWKFEQTDEEFIPLHRVVHVRKMDLNGGEVVWDRRRRLDLIFGSGKRVIGGEPVK